LFAFFRT